MSARVVEDAAVDGEVIVMETWIHRSVGGSCPYAVTTLLELRATSAAKAKTYDYRLGFRSHYAEANITLGVDHRILLARLIHEVWYKVFLWSAVSLACANAVEESYHLLQIFRCVHSWTAMTTLSRICNLSPDTSSLQKLIEFLTLTNGNDIILLTMEDDNRRVVLVDILNSAETAVFVWFLIDFRLQQHILRAVLTHSDMIATVHSRKVNRARPVAGCIYIA